MKLSAVYQHDSVSYPEITLCDQLLKSWGRFRVYKELTFKNEIDIQLVDNAMTIMLKFNDIEWLNIQPLLADENYSELFRTLYGMVKEKYEELVVEAI